jgi:polysaccharide biosynthesis protein PelA
MYVPNVFGLKGYASLQVFGVPADFEECGGTVRFIALTVLAGVSLVASPATTAFKWAISYAQHPRPEEFQSFELIVLDSDASVSLPALARPGRDLLAYLSLGEIEQHRPYFTWAKSAGILLGENPNWHGSFYVDVRQESWRRRVVDELVPAMLAAGFNGVFLDTLDDAAALEGQNPQSYRGMKTGAAALVRSLRDSFPRMCIMLNRGYDLFPAIAPFVDILLGESVYTTYETARRGYVRVPAAQYEEQVRRLNKARQANPKLKICSLDYWDPEARKEMRRIYRVERANGFAPYVATRELDRVVREP